ncbi:hypothetical protein ABEY41_04385, partial [Peribacillus butanolivorans]|uniref:hypothetical protein n=1 Tax=Peribacillus butanolivorans TaxID=421767 RepID=UPI003D2DA751
KWWVVQLVLFEMTVFFRNYYSDRNKKLCIMPLLGVTMTFLLSSVQKGTERLLLTLFPGHVFSSQIPFLNDILNAVLM